MTDIKQCPACGNNNIVSSVCKDCGYNNSMLNKFQHTLTISAPTNGTIGGATTGDKFPLGTVVTLTATPSSNYQFSKWTVDGVYVYSNPLRMNMSKDITVSVTFAAQKTLTIGAHTNGTMKVNGVLKTAGTYYYDVNTELVLEAVADEFYEFIRWSTDETDNPITIIMTGNKTYTPSFDLAYLVDKVIFIEGGVRIAEASADGKEVVSVVIADGVMTITVAVIE